MGISLTDLEVGLQGLKDGRQRVLYGLSDTVLDASLVAHAPARLRRNDPVYVVLDQFLLHDPNPRNRYSVVAELVIRAYLEPTSGVAADDGWVPEAEQQLEDFAHTIRFYYQPLPRPGGRSAANYLHKLLEAPTITGTVAAPPSQPRPIGWDVVQPVVKGDAEDRPADPPSPWAEAVGPVYTPRGAAGALGMSSDLVDDLVRQKALLAIPIQEEPGAVYPVAQFKGGRVLAGLSWVMAMLQEGIDALTLAVTMNSPQSTLDGRTPWDELAMADETADPVSAELRQFVMELSAAAY